MLKFGKNSQPALCFCVTGDNYLCAYVVRHGSDNPLAEVVMHKFDYHFAGTTTVLNLHYAN